MPTFNQLVRKGRQTAVKKSTAEGLQLPAQENHGFPVTAEARRLHSSKDSDT